MDDAGLRRRSHALVIALGVLALASCSEAQPRGRACDEEIKVTAADNGRRLEVEACDRLFVRLGKPEAGDAWVLIDPPDQILRLEDQEPAGGTFGFLAMAEGEGRVVLVARDCPPPLPAKGEGDTAQVACPTDGPPGEADASGARPPLTDAFAVTVVVTAG
jgi:hypothetical protein